MLDRYTNSNLVYYKHNGDGEPYDLDVASYLKKRRKFISDLTDSVICLSMIGYTCR